jgi:predicted ATPase
MSKPELKTEIGGEFIFENGRLSFVDDSGRSVDKNLISFGMTNLGMIQALLKNNVISEGSFIFFDEPETNLHPAWQVVLTKVLIKLAESGVKQHKPNRKIELPIGVLGNN